MNMVSMNMVKVFGLIVIVSVNFVGCGMPHKSTPPKELKLENLFQKQLYDEFAPGREIIVSRVEIPPNTTMDRHWHPGEEFHYYLEGEVEIVIDGDSTFTGKPGTVGHVPFKSMHTAITGEEGVKLLVFRVHTEGQPVRYLEEGGTSEQ